MPRDLKKPFSSSTSRLVISVMGLLQPATTILSPLAVDWAWLLSGRPVAMKLAHARVKPARRVRDVMVSNFPKG